MSHTITTSQWLHSAFCVSHHSVYSHIIRFTLTLYCLQSEKTDQDLITNLSGVFDLPGLGSAWAMARRRSIRRIWPCRAWRLPGRWPDGGLSEGYGHDGPGVCLGDGQTEAYLKDMGLTGLASAWVMVRRRTKEYRHKVDAETRCSGVCLHT